MANNRDSDNDELEIVDLDYDSEDQVQDELKVNATKAVSEKKPCKSGQSSEVADDQKSSSNTIKELEENLAQKEQEIDKLRDRLLRQQADFENFRKRTQKDVKEIQELASEGLIKDLLPVLDNIERAIEASLELGEDNPHVKGLRLMHEQFWKVITDQGIQRIESLNKPIDTSEHMAVNAITSTDYPDNTVVEEYQPGYTMKSKVIRPSMVVVSRQPTKKNSENKEDISDEN